MRGRDTPVPARNVGEFRAGCDPSRWGNPERRARAYPAMFIGTGLWDSQVQYWEPAKYVARLRDLNTSSAPVLFRTNMDAGHGGKSGRFRRYRELAEMYAFMLDQLGVGDDDAPAAD